MNTLARTVGACILLLLPQIASADNPQFSAGAGDVSCGQYLEDRALQQKALNSVYASWMQGFLTALNFYKASSKSDGQYVLIPDAPTLLAYADRHCRDNPLDIVASAAVRLNGELPKRTYRP